MRCRGRALAALAGEIALASAVEAAAQAPDAGPPCELPAGVETRWASSEGPRRRDDRSSIAYFHLDRPESGLPALAPDGQRVAGP